MGLINISYGSIASSETMNTNFQYLENKILDHNTTVAASISSLASNIATINSSISSLAETIEDELDSLSDTLETYKNKLKLMINSACMVPDWDALTAVTITQNVTYTVPANGYLLLMPKSSSTGTVQLNDTLITAKAVSSSYDYASGLITIPVNKNDSFVTTILLDNAYMLPAREISIENF